MKLQLSLFPDEPPPACKPRPADETRPRRPQLADERRPRQPRPADEPGPRRPPTYSRDRPLYRLLIDDRAISASHDPRAILNAARHALTKPNRRIGIIIVQPGRALQLRFTDFVQYCARLPDFLDC